MPGHVLLINTNRCVTPDPVFPLGLAYVNSALRRAGYTTSWYDCFADAGNDLSSVLDSCRPEFVGISLRNIDDVLIRKKVVYFDSLASICQTIRSKTNAPIVLGGSGFSIFPSELLELSGVDYGICGEAEKSFVLLLNALQNHADPSSIPGLVWRDGTQIRLNHTESMACPEPLEVSDRPSRLLQHYLDSSGMLNVQTQRGCSFGCCYCTYPLIEGRRHRRRPPEETAAEFKMLEGLGAKYLFIVDSIFNSCAQHVVETCEALIRADLKLKWGCFLRPQGLTPAMFKLMARAGLAHVEFGSDSFSDEVLHACHKNFTFDDILASSECARQENLDFCHFLICGGPGEAMATLETGFHNSLRIKSGVNVAVTGMRLYPGTALHARAIQEGVITPKTNLLHPHYYLAKGLTVEEVFQSLQKFAASAPNWIVGDPSPAYARLVERLRQRRVVGPLWSYFSMIQRLWPQNSPFPQT